MATTAQQNLLEALKAKVSGQNGNSRFDQNFSLGRLQEMANQEQNQAIFKREVQDNLDKTSEGDDVIKANRQSRMQELKMALDFKQKQQASRNESALAKLQRDLDPNKKAEFELRNLSLKKKSEALEGLDQFTPKALRERQEAAINPNVVNGMVSQMQQNLPDTIDRELIRENVRIAMINALDPATGKVNTAAAASELNKFGQRLVDNRSAAQDAQMKAMKMQMLATTQDLKNKKLGLENMKLYEEVTKGNKGFVGITDKTLQDMQDEVRQHANLSDKMTRLSDMFDPKLFNFWTQTGAELLAKSERFGNTLDAKERNLVNKYTLMRTQVVQVFNAYRKEITGAAASNQELERLEKGFIHMKLSPSEMKIALDGLRSVPRQQMLFTKLLQERNKAGQDAQIDFSKWQTEVQNKIESGRELTQTEKELQAEIKNWQKLSGFLDSKDSWDNLEGPRLNENGEADGYMDPKEISTDGDIIEVQTANGKMSLTKAQQDRILEAYQRQQAKLGAQ